MLNFYQKTKTLLFIFFCFFFNCYSYAACNGCNQTVDLTLSNQLTIDTNKPGYTMQSSSFNVGRIDMGYGTSYKGASFTNIDGSLPPFVTIPNDWVYQKVDDYMSVAVRLRQSCGYIYAPFNRRAWLAATCRAGLTADYWEPTTWDSSIRIDKTMVGGTYANNILIGTFGGCNGDGCSTQDQIYARVYLNYNITVPQNCVINSGEVVEVDFGNIPSTAFQNAGQRASNVNPVSRELRLQCNNIEPSALLSVRLQANNASGNAIVSTNKDVGFVVADGNGKELTPNLATSIIPFSLSSSGNSASIPITVWPVSTTGATPSEGAVSAVGFLRIDFQ